MKELYLAAVPKRRPPRKRTAAAPAGKGRKAGLKTKLKANKGSKGRKRSKTFLRAYREGYAAAERRLRQAVVTAAPELAPVPPVPEPPPVPQGGDDASVDYHRGYAEGYQKGVYHGGDAMVDGMLPPDAILPGLSVGQIIHIGLSHLTGHFYPLHTSGDIFHQMIHALDHHQPYSLVRLGDGELLTLAQDLVLPVEKVRKEGAFLPYAGVEVPDYAARDELAAAIRSATAVGIPKQRLPNFFNLLYPVFEAHGIDYRSLRLTHSIVNYKLHQDGYLPQILEGRRVLAVGNRAQELADVLSAQGFQAVGAVQPVLGVKDVSRVMEEIRAFDFDIALVSAGIAAVLICPRIAEERGKVAVDFGHLADSLIRGEARLG